MYGYVYITENLVNGKLYIGQHSSNEFDPFYFGSGTALNNALSKYGKENFQVRLLKKCYSLKELNYWERFLIQKHNAQESPLFYNIQSGGRYGGKPNKEQRRLMGERSKRFWEKPSYRKLFQELRRKEWEDPEYRKAQSLKAKRQWKNKEYKEFIRNKNQEYYDDGGREKHSKRRKEYWKDESHRKHMSEIMKNNIRQCPYCGKWANPGNYKQFHGDACGEKI